MKFANMPLVIAIAVSAAALTGASNTVAQSSPYGRWLAEDINGGGVIDRLQTTLDLSPDGRASGFGGCNGFRGQAHIDGAKLSFGPLASTRKACTPAVMNQEHKFYQALEATAGWRMEQTKLLLTDAAGKVVARLTRL